MIDIVLADDHGMVRRGFRMLIEQQEDLRVVGEASSSDEAFDLVVGLKPAVLVTDVSMGAQKSGLVLAGRVHDAAVTCAVVVLTMHAEQEYLRQAMKSGALGYVLKESSDDELFEAIRAAAKGETYICHDMLGDFVQDAIQGVDPAKAALTPHEVEIVAMAVRGFSNADIAAKLAISVKTVEGQKRKIMAKLGLHSRPELFDYAVAHHLLEL
jgi:two-component system response regulator NreC